MRLHLWNRDHARNTKAEYRGGKRIRVEFNNGTSAVVDLESEPCEPVFEPLRDRNPFRRFRVSDVLHTIVRDNDADFAPEFHRCSLYSLDDVADENAKSLWKAEILKRIQGLDNGGVKTVPWSEVKRQLGNLQRAGAYTSSPLRLLRIHFFFFGFGL